jgi:hypothetical protein
MMATQINFITDAAGQILTEPCYDAELKYISWDASSNTIETVFRCPKNITLKLAFRGVVQFKIDGLETYNISATFFITSGCGFDHEIALQYLKELFREKDIVEEAARYRVQQRIAESLTLCSDGSYVLFANDAAAGSVMTILSKALDAEFL